MTGVYIIAEAGVNHNGSMQMARDLIDLAAEAGADAVKFQVFKADRMAICTAPKAPYQQKITSGNESQLEMLSKLQLSADQYKELCWYCTARKIDFLASPFDLDSVDLLAVQLNVPRIKIASGEITNAPLLICAARTGKSIILSTGMSSLGEVEAALRWLAFGCLQKHGHPTEEILQAVYASPEGQRVLKEKVSLLHCTSEYPAPFAEINLRAMDTLRQAFDLQTGYSDHSPGISIAIAAAARGACIIEKHFTLDKKLPGPDHAASLEPHELQAMISSIREVEMALGSSTKTVSPAESRNQPLVRKSLVAAKPIRQGEILQPDHLAVKRPGTGMAPLHYWDLIGKRASKDYSPDEQVIE